MFTFIPAEWNIFTDKTNAKETTDGLNAVIHAAQKAGHTEIFIPRGNYLIDGVNETGKTPEEGAGIRPPSNIKILMHPETVLNVKPNGSYGYSCFHLETVENVTISGGKIRGDRYEHDFTGHGDLKEKDTHEWGFGINIQGSKNIIIENVDITGLTGDCIFICAKGLLNVPWTDYTPSQNITIRNCILDGSRRNNISVTAGEGVLIQRNVITNAGINDGCKPGFGIDIEGYGEGDIDFEEPKNIIVSKNTFIGNVNQSACNYNGYGVVFEGNYSDNSISYGYGTDTVLFDNVFSREDKKQVAITALGVSNGKKANNVSIKGNVVKGFSSGIDARGKSIVVTGNALSELGGVPISTYKAENILITNNIVHECKGTLCKTFQSGDVFIQGNKFSDSDVTAFEIVDSVNVKLLMNDIRKSKQGFRIMSSSAKIMDNIIDLSEHESPSYGIYFDKFSDVIMKRNHFEGLRNMAIYGDSKEGRKVELKQNVIKDFRAIIPVYIVGGKDHKITDNDITFNRSSDGGYGIYLKDTDNVMIAGNSVLNNSPFKIASHIKTNESVNSKVINNTLCKSGKLLLNETDSEYGNILI